MGWGVEMDTLTSDDPDEPGTGQSNIQMPCQVSDTVSVKVYALNQLFHCNFSWFSNPLFSQYQRNPPKIKVVYYLKLLACQITREKQL